MNTLRPLAVVSLSCALLGGAACSSSDEEATSPGAVGGGGGVSGAAGQSGGGAAGSGGAPESIPTGFDIPTDLGIVRGVSDEGVRAFKGIPFAAPPVGDDRWKRPKPAAPWSEPRDASQFGPVCTQVSLLTTKLDSKSKEDCLYLNVWTPDPAPTAARPVMVWFHGGAFIAGSGSDSGYDGVKIVAASSVVLVTVNYRLGALGFLAHPALAAEDPDGHAGNYAFWDQTAALEWVKRNIHAFGGDPGNVTIFGESAGGASVSAHLVAPPSRGLFHRAISQSGVLFLASLPTVSEAGQMADDLAAAVGCAAGDLACLRAKPAGDLATALHMDEKPPGDLFTGTISTAVYFPTMDGEFFPGQPAELFTEGKMAKVPTLLTTTREEARLFHGGFLGDVDVTTQAEYEAALSHVTGPDVVAEVVARYPLSSYPTPDDALATLETDAVFRCPTRRQARAQVKAGLPTWRGQFSRPTEAGLAAGLGAAHASDIPYVFGNDGTLVVLTEESRTLVPVVMGYWTRFAEKGDPNGGDAPPWDAFSAGEAYLDFDLPIVSSTGLGDDVCDFWDGVTLKLPKTY
jgi:para-nitrobenzyl esterase